MLQPGNSTSTGVLFQSDKTENTDLVESQKMASKANTGRPDNAIIYRLLASNMNGSDPAYFLEGIR